MIRLCAFADEADERLDGQIEALKQNGIALIELRGIDGVNVSALTEETAMDYARRLADAGIRVWSLGSPMGKVDISCDFAAYEQEVLHMCRLARIFGTTRIRMFSFYGAHDNEDEVVRRLIRMAEIAEGEGVKLLHENEKKIYGDTLGRVQRLLSLVPALGMIYDPANFIEVGEAPKDTLDALHARADYFHIKDAVAGSCEIVPAGCGDADILGLISRIGDRDTVLTLEPHLMTFIGFSDLDDNPLKNKYHYESAREAFDAAVSALKVLLHKAGYTEIQGGYVKQ
jgi:sugar phosphate isomerase/epimerase